MSKIHFNNLPTSTGVYIFRDKNKKVLYVGKAINLKNRVKSYFQNSSLLTPKTKALIKKVHKIDHIKVDREIEALLLEADLIKRYKPLYNISLKDDKFYQYIKIEQEERIIEKAPIKIHKISSTRKKKSNNAKYFGPYPETSSIKLILKTLRKIFPYIDCSKAKFKRYQKAKRPCLYGHIQLCPAPCTDARKTQVNNENIKKIIKYLKGDRKLIFKNLQREMKKSAKELKFEKAAVIRDQIQSYEYLTQPIRQTKEYTQNPNLVDDSQLNSLQSLIKTLNEAGLNTNYKSIKTFRIEAYDISNIQGKNAVGSMIVLTGGFPDKKEYRRFKIQTKNTPDDFQMMQEMLVRRFRKAKSKWQLPNLILIDGGKGQLSTALKTLAINKVNIPTIGLAKKFETIIIKNREKFTDIHLEKDSSTLNILKLARNEAHRFAIAYYRKLHRKDIYSNN